MVAVLVGEEGENVLSVWEAALRQDSITLPPIVCTRKRY